MERKKGSTRLASADIRQAVDWINVTTLEGLNDVTIIYNLDGVVQQETLSYTV
jgi:hypothetical protein